MKEKGFTLIELLAVIVILAIIALIATPIILGIIKDSKKEADQRSIENYTKAVENAVVQFQMVTKRMPKDKEDIEPYIKYDGKITSENIIINADGSVYIEGIKDADNKTLANSVGTKQRYTDGEIVYIDVTTGKSCTNYHEDNSKTGYNGIYEGNNSRKTTENQNSCLKFYAFLDDGGKNLNLLLDHNTTGVIAWTNSETTTNTNGPIDVINQLKSDTSEWNVPIISKNYEYKGNNSYKINYNTEKYKARLIEANEIAKITGTDKEMNWKEESSIEWYYFHLLTQNDEVGRGDVCASDRCQYGWLYDRTSTDCINYGCLFDSVGENYGYWTSSAHVDYPYFAWCVQSWGRVFSLGSNVDTPNNYGVRPVITILKSNI